MKRKFKPGDVVEFVEEIREVNWSEDLCKLNGCKIFLVESYVERPRIDTYAAIHLAHLSGKRLRWWRKTSGHGERHWGIWEGWLQRNEFLTAVHKAQKQQKRKDKQA